MRAIVLPEPEPDFEQFVADHAKAIVREAATPIRPGANITEQIQTAEKNLGYAHELKERWRVRAAWEGRAGAWKAAPFEKLKARHRRWLAKQRRQTEPFNASHESAKLLSRVSPSRRPAARGRP